MDACGAGTPPTVVDKAEDANPHAEPSDGHSEEVDSGGQDNSPEVSIHQVDQPKAPRPPRLIGGRRLSPQTPTQQQPKDDAEAKLKFTPRPELICRKDLGSWQWEVVLSADDECRIVEVRHDDGKLMGMLNDECRLSSFAGSLSIAFEDGERRESTLFDGTPMVFKSRNNWNGDGRKVRAITSGFYVVIVPKGWKRTGPVPVEPAGCTDPNFLAHFFWHKRGEPAGDMGGFEECEVALTQSGLELTGDRVFDDSEDGELFVGDVPKLNPLPGVVWARVGEEAQGGWSGENFKPSEKCLADVLHSHQGRFFARVYDNVAKLLDSGEFRYLRDLQEIRVNGEPYSANTLLVPPSTGHSPTELQFVGADGATIHPVLATEETHATVRPGGVLIIAPHPKGDDISCALASGTSRVDTVIKLPRIWWRMEQGDDESDEWRDTPMAMTRQEYREYANAGAIIRLRLPPRATSVSGGFDEELERVYRPPTRGEETKISLADFIDYPQIDLWLNEDALLNVQCGEAVLTFIRVSADPVPTIISFTSEPATVAAGERATLQWVTRNAESNGVVIDPGIGSVESSGSMPVAPTETMIFTLRLTASGMDDVARDIMLTVRSRQQPGEKLFARVKRTNGGCRKGKGFSRGEIHAAGFTDADAARRSIPIDRRRRSTHRANIDTIRRLTDA